jgi:hypothetical protein
MNSVNFTDKLQKICFKQTIIENLFNFASRKFFRLLIYFFVYQYSIAIIHQFRYDLKNFLLLLKLNKIKY